MEQPNNPKGQERGLDIFPQQTGTAKKAGGWGRVRAVTKVLGLSHKRHNSQSNDIGE